MTGDDQAAHGGTSEEIVCGTRRANRRGTLLCLLGVIAAVVITAVVVEARPLSSAGGGTTVSPTVLPTSAAASVVCPDQGPQVVLRTGADLDLESRFVTIVGYQGALKIQVTNAGTRPIKRFESVGFIRYISHGRILDDSSAWLMLLVGDIAPGASALALYLPTISPLQVPCVSHGEVVEAQFISFVGSESIVLTETQMVYDGHGGMVLKA